MAIFDRVLLVHGILGIRASPQPCLAGGRIPRVSWTKKQHGIDELRET